jgi:hypothetical protein
LLASIGQSKINALTTTYINPKALKNRRLDYGIQENWNSPSLPRNSYDRQRYQYDWHADSRWFALAAWQIFCRRERMHLSYSIGGSWVIIIAKSEYGRMGFFSPIPFRLFAGITG